MIWYKCSTKNNAQTKYGSVKYIVLYNLNIMWQIVYVLMLNEKSQDTKLYAVVM